MTRGTWKVWVSPKSNQAGSFLVRDLWSEIAVTRLRREALRRNQLDVQRVESAVMFQIWRVESQNLEGFCETGGLAECAFQIVVFSEEDAPRVEHKG